MKCAQYPVNFLGQAAVILAAENAQPCSRRQVNIDRFFFKLDNSRSVASASSLAGFYKIHRY